MKYNFTLLIFILLFVGCRKEEIVVEVIKEVEATTSWNLNTNFVNLAKIKINCFATEENLFLYGPGSFSTINKQQEVSHSFTLLSYPAFYRLPISEHYFIEADNEWLRFVHSKYPAYDQGAFWINLKELAPDFQRIDFGRTYQNSTISINSKGQCLLPIHSDNADRNIIVYLFSTSTQDNQRITVTDTTRIAINSSSDTEIQYAYFSKAIDDYFIISHEGATHKIYTDGQFKKVIDTSIINLFQTGNRLYGLTQENQIYISENDGESWAIFEGLPSDLRYANYFNIEDQLIASRNDKMYSIAFTGNTYTIREIINEGLETNEITSISQFGDSVYVSTYTGLFLRHKSGFFEYKD